MTDTITRSTVTASIGLVDLDVLSLRLSLDEQATPYVRGELVCQLTDPAGELDPRDDLRISIAIHQEWEQPTHADQDRTFDLAVTARRKDTVQGTVTFKVASTEAKLLLNGDTTGQSDFYQVSTQPYMLRTLLNAVLAEYGAGPLQAGAADDDITILLASTNLVPNGNVRTAIGGWDNGGATGTTTRQTGLVGGPVPGVTTFIRCAFTANSGNGVGGPRGPAPASAEAPAVGPLTEYGVSVWVRANVAKKIRLGVVWYDAAGAAIGATSYMPTLTEPTLVANTWTQVIAKFTSPALAVKCRLLLQPDAAVQWVNTNTFDALGWSLEEYPDWPDDLAGWPPHGFDGATAADTYYTYAWDGTASASSSHRTPLFERDFDSTLVRAGQPIWDFINPLVKAAGLRLFCDEQDRWWLVDPLTYTVAGTTIVDDDNAFTAEDDIDLEIGDWADQVVVTYRWIGTDGAQHEQIAQAFVVSPPLVRMLAFEFSDTPYPGPGAAQAILDRAQLRGRVLSHDTLLDLDASPARAITSDISEAPASLDDVISSVEFTWSEDEDGTRITTRGAAS